MPDRTVAAVWPVASVASTVVASREGGHGLSARWTGQVGPAETVPSTPVNPAVGRGAAVVGTTDTEKEGVVAGDGGAVVATGEVDTAGEAGVALVVSEEAVAVTGAVALPLWTGAAA